AGDTRSSEQVALASIHTLFVREHNRIAKKLIQINPHWTGDTVYEETRKIVGGILQKITFEDYLPELFGHNPLPRYSGYKYWINPGIINSVAAAAYRFGHSTIRPSFDILDENHRKVGAPIPLKHMFFNNTYINRHGIDHLLLGLCTFEAEKVDRSFSAGIMNHLFERDHSPGLNLIALNIQRGRDHGLPGYNDFRRYCGLSDARSFKDTIKEITPENRKILATLYKDDPTIADLFVAGIAERPLPGSLLGPTFTCLIKEQFARLRDGDRFFYRRGKVFTRSQLQEIKKSSLSRVLCDNLKGGKKLTVQKNTFRAINNDVQRVPCSSIPKIDLNHWKM
ncbi:eosinophil peroxidase-like, partial [Dendronephthya gigantea]|uniref:eosinophil peroxidase-like n=1 Tax=Dendronephthya gigantea TaxID=151771 RepID=UPI00106C8E25